MRKDWDIYSECNGEESEDEERDLREQEGLQLRALKRSLINDFLDITKEDKFFMSLWNDHVLGAYEANRMQNPLQLCRSREERLLRTQGLIAALIWSHTAHLQRLLQHFSLFLATLIDNGLLTQQAMIDLLTYLDFVRRLRANDAAAVRCALLCAKCSQAYPSTQSACLRCREWQRAPVRHRKKRPQQHAPLLPECVKRFIKRPTYSTKNLLTVKTRSAETHQPPRPDPSSANQLYEPPTDPLAKHKDDAVRTAE